MNNNTQIETVEDKCRDILNYLFPNNEGEMSYLQTKNSIDALKSIAKWQKEQDEAKYKELLDSHNELLEGIKEISEISDGIGVLNQNWLKGFCEELINKAKNIKL